MGFWILPVLLIVLGLLGLVALLAKKAPHLSMLDVSSMEKERLRQVKERLIMGKLERIKDKRLGKVSRAASGLAKGTSKMGRRAVQRLYRLEQYYQRLQKSAEGGPQKLNQDAIRRLLGEAEGFVRQDEYIQAEKRYVEIISHNPKSVEAYEGLGRLYIRSKQYGQARESLKFALRLSKSDASVHMSLAELELAEGNAKAAVEALRTCIELRPKNPKYLDTYIQAALDAKLPEDAKKGIKLLKKVNPENQKIAEFQAKAKELAE